MEISNKNKSYRVEKHLVWSCQYHVIFCPKYRRKVLQEPIAIRLKEIVFEYQEKFRYKVIEIEVLSDHVHLLLEASPSVGIYPIVTKIKGITAKLLREEFPQLKSRLPCLWSRSKFISSVGEVSLETVKKYIEDQKQV